MTIYIPPDANIKNLTITPGSLMGFSNDDVAIYNSELGKFESKEKIMADEDHVRYEKLIDSFLKPDYNEGG